MTSGGSSECTGIPLIDSIINNSVLDVKVILIITAILTSIWVLLWIIGPMKQSRSLQTWWQFIGYTSLFLIGLWRIIDENQLSYLIEPSRMYTPHSPLIGWTKFYFETEFAWYISSLICTLVNREAKDFHAMLFHHIVTPPLIYFSYYCSFYQSVGLAVMILHDTSDVFLHSAKLFHYAGFAKITDITFGIFALMFFVTRLCLFPFIPIAYLQQDLHRDACGNSMAFGLGCLVFLHIFWFSLIVQMILKFAKDGKVDGDIRDEDAIQKEKSQSEEKKKLK